MMERELMDLAWETIHERWPIDGRDPWSETEHLPDCVDYEADAGPFFIRLRLDWESKTWYSRVSMRPNVNQALFLCRGYEDLRDCIEDTRLGMAKIVDGWLRVFL